MTGQLLTDHLAVGGEGCSLLPCQAGLFPALPLWLYWWCQPQTQRPRGHDPGGWGLLNQAHSRGITSPGRGRRGPRGQEEQLPAWETMSVQVRRDAAGRPLGLSLLVVIRRLAGSGQARTPLEFKSACDSGEGCAPRRWEPGVSTKSQPPRDPSSRYPNRGVLIAENFETPLTCA